MHAKVLIPLLLGFAFNSASAFTTAFSRWWGRPWGQLAVFMLRNVLGIPLWVIGFGLAVRSSSPQMFAASSVGKAVGWLLLGAGGVVQLLAIAALRLPAARPSVDDALVSRGVYGHIRHPIYAGLMLEFAGSVLVQPRQAVVVAAIVGCVWAWVQARLEELDLVQRMPEYREYMTQVPRFLPRLAGKGPVRS